MKNKQLLLNLKDEYDKLEKESEVLGKEMNDLCSTTIDLDKFIQIQKLSQKSRSVNNKMIAILKSRLLIEEEKMRQRHLMEQNLMEQEHRNIIISIIIAFLALILIKIFI
jgi:hypothetical protein